MNQEDRRPTLAGGGQSLPVKGKFGLVLGCPDHLPGSSIITFALLCFLHALISLSSLLYVSMDMLIFIVL